MWVTALKPNRCYEWELHLLIGTFLQSGNKHIIHKHICCLMLSFLKLCFFWSIYGNFQTYAVKVREEPFHLMFVYSCKKKPAFTKTKSHLFTFREKLAFTFLSYPYSHSLADLTTNLVFKDYLSIFCTFFLFICLNVFFSSIFFFKPFVISFFNLFLLVLQITNVLLQSWVIKTPGRFKAFVSKMMNKRVSVQKKLADRWQAS